MKASSAPDRAGLARERGGDSLSGARVPARARHSRERGRRPRRPRSAASAGGPPVSATSPRLGGGAGDHPALALGALGEREHHRQQGHAGGQARHHRQARRERRQGEQHEAVEQRPHERRTLPDRRRGDQEQHEPPAAAHHPRRRPAREGELQREHDQLAGRDPRTAVQLAGERGEQEGGQRGGRQTAGHAPIQRRTAQSQRRRHAGREDHDRPEPDRRGAGREVQAAGDRGRHPADAQRHGPASDVRRARRPRGAGQGVQAPVVPLVAVPARRALPPRRGPGRQSDRRRLRRDLVEVPHGRGPVDEHAGAGEAQVRRAPVVEHGDGRAR